MTTVIHCAELVGLSTIPPSPPAAPVTTVAVVGSGLAGAACAAALHAAGLQVTLFEKSRGVGGRMATRRAPGLDAQGNPQAMEFDHGAQYFGASHPRFRATLRRAETAGVVAAWAPQVHAAWPAPAQRQAFVAVPGMPALCRHLLGDLPVQLEHAVQRLQRSGEGWYVVNDQQQSSGPFQHVVLAMPPTQAARLLAGHQDHWADTLATLPMQACWTLMAVTDEPDWPWDAVEPSTGPIAWLVRNDRKPGRSAPAGKATWVAHASAEWSQAHLEDDPKDVQAALCAAVAQLLPRAFTMLGTATATPATPLAWHHSSVHRWRYAQPAPCAATALAAECWWDGNLGLGVCGDYFSGGTVQAAWRSGDELADTLLAWLEQQEDVNAVGSGSTAANAAVNAVANAAAPSNIPQPITSGQAV